MDDATPQFRSPDTLPDPPGYSHVVSARPARVVWTSGQVAMRADGAAAPPGDWEAQTRLCFENVGRALEAAGATWRDVVKLTYFVVDVTALQTIRAVRDEFVDTENPPASSLVQVAGLFRRDLLIEVEAVACPPG
jgi:enamine deaminase RidA (YjgF/YER057c/UK114 family)